VPRALVHSPGFAALAEALERHVSPAARAVTQAPFVFGDGTEELRTLLSAAILRTRIVHHCTPNIAIFCVNGSSQSNEMAKDDDAVHTRPENRRSQREEVELALTAR
jgi:hypothetical protein